MLFSKDAPRKEPSTVLKSSLPDTGAAYKNGAYDVGMVLATTFLTWAGLAPAGGATEAQIYSAVIKGAVATPVIPYFATKILRSPVLQNYSKIVRMAALSVLVVASSQIADLVEKGGVWANNLAKTAAHEIYMYRALRKLTPAKARPQESAPQWPGTSKNLPSQRRGLNGIPLDIV